MKKRFWIMLAGVALLIFLLLPAMAETSGVCGANGDNLTWILTDDGVLTIDGTGEMANYTVDDPAPWPKSNIKRVIVMNGVTSIGDYAFYRSGLDSVSLPMGIVNIGFNAFGYSALSYVVLPDSVTLIDGFAFDGCHNLSSITMPASLTVIGESAFGACISLTSISIPEGVTSIGNSAFFSCSSLSRATILSRTVNIASGAFYNSSNVTIYCYDTVENYCLANNLSYELIAVLQSGFCGANGDNLTWTLTNSGLLTISGTGAMEDYSWGWNDEKLDYCNTAPWLDFNSQITSVVFEPGITHIGECAFYRYQNIRNVTIPSSVISIGYRGFADCSNLKNITIPSGVTSIGGCAFLWCNGLLEVTIPESVTSIGESAFSQCSCLTSLTIPNGVTSIAEWTFESCTELRSIDLPSSITSIGSYAFANCPNLQTVYYNGTRNQWNAIDRADNNDPLTSANIVVNPSTSSGSFGVEGNNLTWTLSNWTLTISGTGMMPDFDVEERPWDAYLEEIHSVIIQNGVTSIGNNAFFDSWQLAEISLPESVVSIGNNAFSECPELIAFHVAEQNSVYTSLDDVLYSKNMKTLIKCPGRKTGIFRIPESVTTIAAAAFVECKNLTEVTIPDSVTNIENAAFRGCSGLANNLILPSGLTILNLGVFKDCSFESVEIPQNVQIIGRMAFTQCYDLQSVIIPASVTEIQEFAFYSCDNLQTVYYAGTNAQWDAITKSEGNDPLTSANIIYNTNSGACGAEGDNLTWELSGGTLTISGTGAMQNYSYAESAPWSDRLFTSVVLNEGVTSVGNYAFCDKYKIQTVALPDSLTSIGSSAFWGCSALKSIRIPKNVTNIAIGAFGNCYQLAMVEVAEQNSAFTAIDNVVYSQDMTKLIFCSGRKEGLFRIPETVSVVYACAFSGCLRLTEVIIPEGVTQINNSVFRECERMSIIHIPQSVQRINSFAFELCYGLQYVYYEGDYDQWIEINIDITNEDLSNAQILYNCYGIDHEISWSLNNGVLTVSGNAVVKPVPWEDGEIRDQIFSVILSEGMTEIGAGVFQDCSNLSSVSLPQSLTKIGGSAFTDCDSLTQITIPAGVTNLDTSAFTECSSLAAIHVASGNTVYSDVDGVLFGWGENVLIQYPSGNTRTSYTIPSTVTFIIPGWSAEGEGWSFTGGGVFRNTKNLTAVTIPNGITNIPDSTFYGCENLNSVTIPASVTEIGGYVFGDCWSLENVNYSGTKAQWKKITVANGNDVIKSATVQCSDGVYRPFSWTLENGVLTITGSEMPDYSYEYNNTYESPWHSERANIVSVVLADGVERIGNNAFYDCYSVSGVNIPDSVRAIGDMAFYSCTSLTNVTIPQSVLSIGYSAFNYCTSLTSIVIPASVSEIGAYAFTNCTNLTEIRVAQGNTTYSDVDGVLFGDNGTVLIQYPAGSTRTAYAAPGIVTFLFPGWSASGEGWHVTGGGVFTSAANLREVTIPEEVQIIPDSTFYGCENLTTVTIPASVTQIGGFAFGECGRLETVHYTGTKAQWKDVVVANGNDMILSATVQCSDGVIRPFSWSLENGVLTISGSEMPDFEYGGTPWNSEKEYIVSVVLEEGLSNIGNNAFINCSSLSRINLPSSLTTIGSDAFSFCSSLTSVAIPENVTIIGTGAFDYCTSLTSFDVALENTAYSSADGVLFDKSQSRLIQYPAGNTRDSYIIPASVTSLRIGTYAEGEGWTFTKGGAFSFSNHLCSVTIPTSITSIGDCVFSDCENLNSVTIPNSVTQIGGYAFNWCLNLRTVHYTGSPEQWETIIPGNGNDALASATIIYNKEATAASSEQLLWLPAALNAIESEAFAGIPELTKVYIPATVADIAADAFGDTNVLIFAEPDSEAETFARDHGYTCVLVED